MKFSYQKSIYHKEIPSLVIPVSEILKAKNYKTSEAAFQELLLLNKCLSIYTCYNGAELAFDNRGFSEFCEKIGKTGSVVFSCIPEEDGLLVNCRVVSNDGERVVNCKLIEVLGHHY